MPWSALLMSEITPVETWQPQISDMGIIVFLPLCTGTKMQYGERDGWHHFTIHQYWLLD
jgi:hypothetical protein